MDKLLFLRKQACPDILTGINFLTTIVSETDKYDKNKIIHLLKYLPSTWELVLILESHGSSTIKWWVGVIFLVHHDMIIHTRGGGVDTTGCCVLCVNQIEVEYK